MAREIKLDIIVDDRGAVQQLRQIDRAVDGLGGNAAKATPRVSGLSRALNSVGGTVAKAAAGFFAADAAMRLVTGTFNATVGAGLRMNASLETSTLQFRTLFKDAARAETHVRSLFDFAKRTPFETGPIIEASKKLQIFGGDALNTMDNLRMLGNAAAATGAPINELGFWVGRLFAMLEAGRPFGEAALRLQELGVLAPEVRAEMEALQKAGASTTEVFAVFQAGMEEFTGAMELQQSTWKGLTSTLKETFELLAADAMRGTFEDLKTIMAGLNRALEAQNDEVESRSVPLWSQFLGLVGRMTPIGTMLAAKETAVDLIALDNATAQMIDTLEAAAPTTEALAASVGQFTTVQDHLSDANRHAAETMKAWADETAAAEKAAEKAAKAAERAAAQEWRALQERVFELEHGTGLWVDSQEAINHALQNGIPITSNYTQATDALWASIQQLEGSQHEVNLALQDAGSFIGELQRQVGSLKPSMDDLAQSTFGVRDALLAMFGLSGGLSGLFQQIGTGFLEGIGGLLSQGLSSLTQMATNAIWSGVKAVGGFFKGLFGGRSTQDNVLIQTGRMFGREISKGLADQIAELSQTLGHDMAALLMSLGDIFRDLGGVAEIGFERATEAVRSLFSMIDDGRLTLDQIRPVFLDTFRQLAESIDTATEQGFQSFLSLIDVARSFGISIEDLTPIFQVAFQQIDITTALGQERFELFRQKLVEVGLTVQQINDLLNATPTEVDTSVNIKSTCKRNFDPFDCFALESFSGPEIPPAPDFRRGPRGGAGTNRRGPFQFSAAGGLVDYLACGGGCAGGGLARGTDTVPAMLTPGEFVVSRRGVQAAGVGALRAINAGAAAGNVTTVVHVHGGFLSSPRDKARLAEVVSEQIVKTLKRRAPLPALS